MSTNSESGPTLGLIVGNRGFFPDHLAATGRTDMIRVLEKRLKKQNAVRPSFGNTATRFRASSFHCLTSVTSAPSPTPCACRT